LTPKSLAPANQAPPTIPSSAQEGSTIACDPGTWSGSPTFAFQWLRDGAPIQGEIASSYRLTAGDVAHSVACRVTASNAGGDTDATSSAVVPTRAPPEKVPPTVTGFPPAQGCVPGALSLRISVRKEGLRRAVAFLDGRKVLSSKKHAFTIKVPAGQLKPGRHKLRIVRFYGSKTKVKKSFSFSVCRGGGRSPRIRTRGTPTAGSCTAKDFTIHVTIKGAAAQTIRVRLDHRAASKPGTAVFDVPISVGGLVRGKHRLTITAADSFKNSSRSLTDFVVCA
jgi:hypothetical protein